MHRGLSRELYFRPARQASSPVQQLLSEVVHDFTSLTPQPVVLRPALLLMLLEPAVRVRAGVDLI